MTICFHTPFPFCHFPVTMGKMAHWICDEYGTKKKKSSEETKELSDELSDVIFTVCCIANSHGINLDDAWKKMMDEKHYGRDNQRYERK